MAHQPGGAVDDAAQQRVAGLLGGAHEPGPGAALGDADRQLAGHRGVEGAGGPGGSAAVIGLGEGRADRADDVAALVADDDVQERPAHAGQRVLRVAGDRVERVARSGVGVEVERRAAGEEDGDAAQVGEQRRARLEVLEHRGVLPRGELAGRDREGRRIRPAARRRRRRRRAVRRSGPRPVDHRLAGLGAVLRGDRAGDRPSRDRIEALHRGVAEQEPACGTGRDADPQRDAVLRLGGDAVLDRLGTGRGTGEARGRPAGRRTSP